MKKILTRFNCTLGIKKNVVLHVFGISESAVEEMIKPIMQQVMFDDSKSVKFGIIANESL
ncbi:MAG: hypothetical protein LBS81_01485 [Endomicrobium sp.]|nr:hypothetical protein [Endomicrobium sp.]